MRARSPRSLLSAVTVLFLLLLPVLSHGASALWIAESKGVIKVATEDGAILFEIPDAEGIDGVAVDSVNGRVWTWGNQRLKAYSANGVVQINESHPTLPNKDKPVDMLADTEGVWLAIDKQLFRFDGQGKLKKSIRFKQRIRTLTLDTTRNRLWVAVPGSVFILDSQGRDLKQFRTHFLNIEQLEYDESLDHTWIVVDPVVLRLDAKTLNIKYVSDFGIGFRLQDHASADGQGGLWGAEDKMVSHLNAQGDLDVRFKPFPGNSHAANLQDLAADSDDGSVWVANRSTLKHYNLAGAQQKEFVPDLGDGIIRSINRMALAEPGTEAPVITITSPSNGAFINDNTPTLEFEYTSSGTIDTESIEIKHNDTLLNTDCTADQTTAQCSLNTILDEGEITLTVTIANEDGTRSEPASVTFAVDTLAPVIFISVPQDGLVTNNPSLTLEGNVDEPLDSLTLSHNGSLSTLALSNNTFSHTLTLSEGANTLTVSATDLAGNPDSQTVTVFLDTGIPAIPDLQQITIGNPVNGIVTVTGANNSVEANSRVTITNTRTGERITVTADANGAFTANIAAEDSDTLSIQVVDEAGNQSNDAQAQVKAEGLPIDRSVGAPQLNPAGISSLLDGVSFLYTGSNPIQTGVTIGIIEERRVAVVRGRVLDKQNNPLSGVTVTVKDHPEFGQTLSRTNGLFDLAVNGGGVLTLNYIKEDYLPVQRQVNAPWQDYVVEDDIVMIQLDPQVTPIDLSNSQVIQVARGTPQTDADGTRQATLLFPEGTTATMTLPNGTVQQLATLNVRATEYTVGENGPEAMPAPLPPASGYTYAVELSVDEAIAANASRVNFSQPIPFYVDNFLNFPVGQAVPVGFYDRERGVWVPSQNGRIIKVLSIDNGLALLDVTGTGTVSDPTQLAALGITDTERQQLAGLYQPGHSLWRTRIPHFSSWDCNWPYGPPDDAEPPPSDPPKTPDNDQPANSRSSGKCPGCSINPQTQTLGEEIPVTGTPYSLHYQSDRMPGRKSKSSLIIPLGRSSLPASLKNIVMTVMVAGRLIKPRVSPQAGLSYTYEWDGLDAYGREVYGSVRAAITITYVYPCVYKPGNNGFARFSSTLDAIGTREDCKSFVGTRQWSVLLESPLKEKSLVTSNVNAISNWSLDVQHAYRWYPGESRLIMGNGDFQHTQDFGIHTIAGGGFGLGDNGGPAIGAFLNSPYGVTADAAGNIYIADTLNHRVRKVTPQGIILTLGGTRFPGFSGDGGPAVNAQFNQPVDVAVDGTGNIYVADKNNQRIRKIGTNGIVTTVAGSGSTSVGGFSGDNGPAVQARLSIPHGLALDAAGNLYIADSGNNRIRRIDTNGLIATVVGVGLGFGGDGGLATQARLRNPTDVTVDSEGNLYIADTDNLRIRRVGTDGIISTVVGNGQCCFSGDGGPATQATLWFPVSLTLDKGGNLYFVDLRNNRIRRVSPDGVIITIAGTLDGEFDPGSFSGDGGPAVHARFRFPRGVGVDAADNIYIADTINNRIRRIPRSELLDPTQVKIASEDGKQQFIFDSSDQSLHHKRTINTLTGTTEYEFGRDSAGRLISITDIDGNVTVIERNTAGDPVAIIAPNGQRTALTVNADNHLVSVINPAGEAHQMSYKTGGLLTGFRDPKGQLDTFAYDNFGYLLRDTNAGGGGWTLNTTSLGNGYRTTMTAAEGGVRHFTVNPLSSKDKLQTVQGPDGSVQQRLFKVNGDEVTTQPNGTILTESRTPDPRFGIQSMLPSGLSIVTPSGLSFTETITRSAVLSDPKNPLSLQSLAEVSTVNGRVFSKNYNAATRTFTKTTAAGRTSTEIINAKSKLVRRQITGLTPVDFTYDTRGRLATILRNNGTEQRLTRLSYYANGPQAGLPQSITDAENRVVSFEYDDAGRLTKKILPDNSMVQYGYDANGNITSITPPGRPAHIFNYNAFDLEGGYIPPTVQGVNQPATIYDYNLDEKLVRISRPDGQQISFDYNSGEQLISLTTPGGNYTYTYTPSSGQLDTVSSPDNVVLDYSYDGFLLTGQTWAGAVTGSVRQSYDSSFRMNTQSVNGADTITFGYDNDNLLTQAGSMVIGRDPQKSGLVTSTSLGNVQSLQTYNAFGELSTVDTDINSADIYRAVYTRDKLGRIKQKTEIIAGQSVIETYGYDMAGRLETVNRNGVITVYSYDSNGNRLSKIAGSNSESGIYDEQDRLLSYAGCNYQYTTNGEMTRKDCGSEETAYSYDVLGNLRSAILPDGAQVEYVIDGQNRRIGKKVNGTLVQGFLYQDQTEPVAELNADGSIRSRFVYADKKNIPAYMIVNGDVYRIVSDHLGSPRLVINTANGEIVQRMDYDEFGNFVMDTNPGFQPFGFAGGVYDQHTQLTRFGARDYDARTGRWTIKDPIKFDAGLNLYGYTLNDPINMFDVTGEAPDWAEPVGTVVGVVGGGFVMAGLAIAVGVGGATVAPVLLTAGAVMAAAGGILVAWDNITSPREQIDEFKESQNFKDLEKNMKDLQDLINQQQKDAKDCP